MGDGHSSADLPARICAWEPSTYSYAAGLLEGGPSNVGRELHDATTRVGHPSCTGGSPIGCYLGGITGSSPATLISTEISPGGAISHPMVSPSRGLTWPTNDDCDSGKRAKPGMGTGSGAVAGVRGLAVRSFSAAC